MIRMASWQQRQAFGWGPKITAFRVLMAMMHLNGTVEVGLVRGVIEKMSPIGSAIVRAMVLAGLDQAQYLGRLARLATFSAMRRSSRHTSPARSIAACPKKHCKRRPVHEQS
jgi:hypothetical protein